MATETRFNMSAATLQRLDELLRRTIQYYSDGLLNKYFFSIKNTKLQCMFKFKDDERKRLSAYEKAFYKERDVRRRWLVAEKYCEYLLDKMNKYGLLLPDKIDDLTTAY